MLEALQDRCGRKYPSLLEGGQSRLRQDAMPYPPPMPPNPTAASLTTSTINVFWSRMANTRRKASEVARMSPRPIVENIRPCYRSLWVSSAVLDARPIMSVMCCGSIFASNGLGMGPAHCMLAETNSSTLSRSSGANLSNTSGGIGNSLEGSPPSNDEEACCCGRLPDSISRLFGRSASGDSGITEPMSFKSDRSSRHGPVMPSRTTWTHRESTYD